MKKYQILTKYGPFNIICDSIQMLDEYPEACFEPLFLYRHEELIAVFKDWDSIQECFDNNATIV